MWHTLLEKSKKKDQCSGKRFFKNNFFLSEKEESRDALALENMNFSKQAFFSIN